MKVRVLIILLTLNRKNEITKGGITNNLKLGLE